VGSERSRRKVGEQQVSTRGRHRFERLVSRAVRRLPAEISRHMQNVDVLVSDDPSPEQRRESGIRPHDTLLGLYEGIPLTERGGHYGLVLPDRITLFRRPIEERCRSENELVREIRRTIIHEVAHHFGIDDDRLDELGWG
jgi:predicted Zn-dependent protease with MMP-like domain